MHDLVIRMPEVDQHQVFMRMHTELPDSNMQTVTTRFLILDFCRVSKSNLLV